ncbi:MAG: hypothetical protein WCD24_19380, partial [Serratia inhibens]|uniref:hypothetical protein n=1 Tax=Serratia inhibens TaxID=2338073 RepID=UPI003C7C1BEA
HNGSLNASAACLPAPLLKEYAAFVNTTKKIARFILTVKPPLSLFIFPANYALINKQDEQNVNCCGAVK